MEEQELHRALAFLLMACAVAAFIQLLFMPAPYGRYSQQKGWGPLVNAKLAWVWMESPNLYVAAACWVLGRPACRSSLVNRILLAMFVGHYINRALVFPLSMRGGRPMPLSVMLMAQARYLTAFEPYHKEWMKDPRFVGGCILFLLGWSINYQADAILRNLRSPGQTGYRIPRGGMFEYVSGANYLGEIVEWVGFALACWSLPATTFALFTALNIGPRAYWHHRWYQEKFRGDYPPQRKALIPMIL